MQLVAALVSALATVGAVTFVWLTVRLARELRREDPGARLGELVGDYSATLLRVIQGSANENLTALPIARARLVAAVASAGEPLPAVSGLVTLDTSADPAVVQLQTAQAVDELAGVDPTAP